MNYDKSHEEAIEVAGEDLPPVREAQTTIDVTGVRRRQSKLPTPVPVPSV